MSSVLALPSLERYDAALDVLLDAEEAINAAPVSAATDKTRRQRCGRWTRRSRGVHGRSQPRKVEATLLSLRGPLAGRARAFAACAVSGADRELVRRTRDASLRKAGIASSCPQHRPGMFTAWQRGGCSQRIAPVPTGPWASVHERTLNARNDPGLTHAFERRVRDALLHADDHRVRPDQVLGSRRAESGVGHPAHAVRGGVVEAVLDVGL